MRVMATRRDGRCWPAGLDRGVHRLRYCPAPDARKVRKTRGQPGASTLFERTVFFIESADPAMGFRQDQAAKLYRLSDAGGLDDPRDLASRVKEFWREARRRASLPELPVRRDEPAGAVPPIIAEALREAY